MTVALVSAKTALDLILVSLVFLSILSLWVKLDRREKARRTARKERQAEYSLALLRSRREWDEAQRYHGIGVGR
jgi:hypothetical protein